jgi:hypothetical protein
VLSERDDLTFVRMCECYHRLGLDRSGIDDNIIG